MTGDSIVSDFIESKEITYQEILSNLLDGEQNLDLKTHVVRPKQLASFWILGNLLKDCNYTTSSAIVENFIEKFLRFMISYNRLSRKEVVEAIKQHIPLFDSESPKGNPLTKNLAKKG